MADTIRVLISTDNHVGYAERDPIRGDDSWRTFHEVMCLAREQDVDMVLLGGDLFHDNLPSRKSMYNVMRSLRLNCYGDKPCELELLSDGSEHFDSTIGHANYEDPDINVAIPVFSIHGNHDDPSGEGYYAALDILEMAGLINYFGRVPESDNITVRPLFFQKGRTKLALYGLSNVRDERLHRTFRDGKAKFMRPGTQQSDWFNLLCVHQNHHAHSETSYLPEEQLPEYMDLVIWGHEHECDPIAHKNPERGFRVLQPGSTIATSLIPGESAQKQVFILTITGRDSKLEPIPLKTVRPFIYKDIVLTNEKEAMRIVKKNNHRSELTRFLESIVKKLIAQARADWRELQGPEYDPNDPDAKPMPLPLVRLRVDTTSPDGGVTKFDVENPQRFSNRFTNDVANRNDVISCYARKKAASRAGAANGVIDDKEIMAKFSSEEWDAIKVQNIVKEFLAAQSLTILPQNYFGEAVTHYIDKDDKHAMEHFVNHALSNQIKNLVKMHEDDDDDENDEDDEDSLKTQIEHYRALLEDEFRKGKLKNQWNQKRKFKPKPDGWDSDEDGHWEDQPGTLIRADEDDGDDDADSNAMDFDGENDNFNAKPASRTTKASRGATRGGRGRGSRARGTPAVSTRGNSTRGRGAGTKSSSSTTTTSKRTKKSSFIDDDDDEHEDEEIANHIIDDGDDNNDDDDDADNDVIMIDDDDPEDSQAMFVPQRKPINGTSRTSRATSTTSSAVAAVTNTRSRKAASPVKKGPKAQAPRSIKPASAAAAAAAANNKNKQSTLSFGGGGSAVTRTRGRGGKNGVEEIEDDDDDDDEEEGEEDEEEEDAFEPVSSARTRRAR